MAVRWLYIRMVVVWGASLGGLDSIRFGGGPILRLWFNSTDRLIESFVVFAGWLFEPSSSSSGNGRLVLATVLSYLSAYLPACLPVSVSVSGSIRGEQFESIRAFDRADPSYGRSLAVHSDGGCLGCLPRRP